MSEKQKPELPEGFSLLAEFNAGSGEAFSRIVDEHSARLINFLFRYTRDHAAAEDLAQEAFLRLYRSASDLKPGARLSTILYRIAYNLAVDLSRRKKARGGELSLDAAAAAAAGAEPAAPAGSGPEALYERARAGEKIEEAFLSLPAAQRLALTLKVYEDRSYDEIAAVMETSVSAVESLLFRARQSLAKKLNK